MEHSPGILFWILSVVCVVATVVAVTARRGLYVGIALLISILSFMNLLLSLELVGLSFIYSLASLFVIAALYFALKKSNTKSALSITLESHSKLAFKFILSVLLFIGCLLLVSQTEIWQYGAQPSKLSFDNLLTAISGKYLLPFLFFKLFLLVLLVIAFFTAKRKSA